MWSKNEQNSLRELERKLLRTATKEPQNHVKKGWGNCIQDKDVTKENQENKINKRNNYQTKLLDPANKLSVCERFRRRCCCPVRHRHPRLSQSCHITPADVCCAGVWHREGSAAQKPREGWRGVCLRGSEIREAVGLVCVSLSRVSQPVPPGPTCLIRDTPNKPHREHIINFISRLV